MLLGFLLIPCSVNHVFDTVTVSSAVFTFAFPKFTLFTSKYLYTVTSGAVTPAVGAANELM